MESRCWFDSWYDPYLASSSLIRMIDGAIARARQINSAAGTTPSRSTRSACSGHKSTSRRVGAGRDLLHHRPR